jgi:hypothetical protein
MTSAPHYLDLTELSRRIHAREISPVETTTAQLTRIERLDGQLKSYAHMMADNNKAGPDASPRPFAEESVGNPQSEDEKPTGAPGRCDQRATGSTPYADVWRRKRQSIAGIIATIMSGVSSSQ